MSAVFHVEHSTRALAIDLYCGLASAQAEFFLGADATVQQFVTRRAQDPNHVALSIGRQSPSPVSLKFWLVRDLKNSSLAAGFARGRHGWISSLQSIQGCVFECTSELVLLASFRILATRPCLAEFAGSISRACSRAVASVAVRRVNREMDAASEAVAPTLSRAFVFLTANPACSLSAVVAAPFLVWTLSLELCGALHAGEIMHWWNIA